MKEKEIHLPSKLRQAGYLFLLANQPAIFAALRARILKDYEPVDQAEEDLFGSDKSAHYYFAHKRTGSRLDVHALTLKNVLAVNFLDFNDNEVSSLGDWDRFLDKYEKSLSETKVDVLGSASVIMPDGDHAEVKEQILESVGSPFPVISGATKTGIKFSQVIGLHNRQYFVVDTHDTKSLHDLLVFDLPQVIWSIQRLQREWSFFEERLEAVLAEKVKTDEELSQILYKKTSEQLSEKSSRFLEEQISRLSTMYSVLATDLQLIKNVSTTIEKDLLELERHLDLFDGGADDEFPWFHVARFSHISGDLRQKQSDLKFSLENTKAAIDIAQTQAELLRGSRELTIQEQTRELLDKNVSLEDEWISLQVAAQVVELVVIFYYSLRSWEKIHITPAFEAIPPIVKLAVVGIFSVSVVTLTHFIGKSLHKRRLMLIPILIACAFVLLSFIAMVLLPGRWA